MSSDTDSMELVELEEHSATETFVDPHGPLARLVVVAASVLASILVLVVVPALGVTYPYSRTFAPSLTVPSETLLRAFGLTPVLTAVAALTVVALIRKLPYGIGAVITLVVGASLTTAAVRAWANGWVPASALPNGNLTACLALISAATLVASPRFLPMVWGLGTVAAVTVAGAAVIGGTASIVGVVTTALIVLGWWAGSSTVMLFSPIAAEREAQNPFDTAALALRRMR